MIQSSAQGRGLTIFRIHCCLQGQPCAHLAAPLGSLNHLCGADNQQDLLPLQNGLHPRWLSHVQNQWPAQMQGFTPPGRSETQCQTSDWHSCLPCQLQGFLLNVRQNSVC